MGLEYEIKIFGIDTLVHTEIINVLAK